MGQVWDVYRSRSGVIVSTIALQLISSLCIGLRFYTRFWKRQAILVSDWLVLAAFVCGSGLSVLEIYGVAVNGFATPLNSTHRGVQGKNERLMLVQHMEYGFVLVGVLSIGLIKLSVCLLYWHIFARVKFRRFLIVWTTIIFAWTVCFVLAELLECGAHPLKVFGTRHDVETYCPHLHQIGYALVGSDVATDLITLVVPIPLVWSMKLPTTRKLLVAATFLVGILAVGASTAKAYIYIAASLALLYEDGIILVTAYSMWNLVEIHVGIIAACGMTLRPVLGRIFPLERLVDRIRSSRSARRRSRGERTSDLPSFVMTESGSDRSERQEERKPGADYKGQGLTFQTSALPEIV